MNHIIFLQAKIRDSVGKISALASYFFKKVGKLAKNF